MEMMNHQSSSLPYRLWLVGYNNWVGIIKTPVTDMEMMNHQSSLHSFIWTFVTANYQESIIIVDRKSPKHKH